MIFFMYMTLVFNRDIMECLHESKADAVMVMSVSAIMIFSVFFINYSHFSFIRSRNKEFGLYLTLGMSRKDIGRIILVENFIIASLSTFAGILAGMVFSKFFFIAVVKLLNISEVQFILDFRQFAATFIVFAAIFSCVVLFSRFATGRLEIAELLKEEAKMSEDRLARPAYGIAGLAALVFHLAAVCIMLSCRADLCGVRLCPDFKAVCRNNRKAPELSEALQARNTQKRSRLLRRRRYEARVFPARHPRLCGRLPAALHGRGGIYEFLPFGFAEYIHNAERAVGICGVPFIPCGCIFAGEKKNSR